MSIATYIRLYGNNDLPKEYFLGDNMLPSVYSMCQKKITVGLIKTVLTIDLN